MSLYVSRNREFHRPFEPIRLDSYYTAAYWSKQFDLEAKDRENGQGIRWLLSLKEEPDSVLGVMGFNHIVRGAFQACYLGFMLDQGFQGQGLMKEALEAGIKYVFEEMGLHRVMANHLVDNHRSAGLLSRLGFEKEGVAKDYLRINGKWQDHVLTSKRNLAWEPDFNS